eukprot:988861-Amphidinium_carterae.1
MSFNGSQSWVKATMSRIFSATHHPWHSRLSVSRNPHDGHSVFSGLRRLPQQLQDVSTLFAATACHPA